MVQCERGDLCQSPQGVYLYSVDGRVEIPVPQAADAHVNVLSEFHSAITGTAKPQHSGAWGRATLEMCEAVVRSAREGREIGLTLQAAEAMPDL